MNLTDDEKERANTIGNLFFELRARCVNGGVLDAGAPETNITVAILVATIVLDALDERAASIEGRLSQIEEAVQHISKNIG